MSQTFDSCPTFYSMQSKKKKFKKNDQKLPFFILHKMKTKTLIKNLGHASLEKNIKNRHRTFQISNLNSN